MNTPKPLTPRQQIKQKIEEYKILFAPVIDTSSTLCFGPHNLPITVKNIRQGKMADSKNWDKEQIITGILTVECEEGNLHFVLDAIKNILLTTSGVRVIMTNNDIVEFTLCR